MCMRESRVTRSAIGGSFKMSEIVLAKDCRFNRLNVFPLPHSPPLDSRIGTHSAG